MMTRHRLSPDLPTVPAKRRNGGFTLIELIISIVLLGFLAAVGTSMISDSFNTTYVVNASQANAGQARYALERLEREIRQVQYSGSSYTIGTMTLTSFVFTKSDGVTVTIANSGTNLNLGYSTPAITSLLSSQVSSFALYYYQADGVTPATGNSDIRFVQISLTLTDTNTSGQSIAQRTRVALRNS